MGPRRGTAGGRPFTFAFPGLCLFFLGGGLLVFWPPPRHIRSRTHSAGPGTGPAALRARDATDPVAPQQGLLCLLPQSPIGEPATCAG